MIELVFYKIYSEKIISMKTGFKNRFQNFKSLENDFALFITLFSTDAVEVPAQMQM